MQFFLRVALAAAVVAAALASASPVSAQQTEARIMGRVLDQSGAALPGVTVTIVSKDTGSERTEVTGADGTYTVTNLAPGTYSVTRRVSTASSRPPGTSSWASGRSSTRHLSLGVAAVTETVQVTAASPVLDTVLGADRRQRLAGGGRAAAGQRPQLRQPDDPGHRRHLGRQRRLGQRAVQRQVEPAELPELRRRRRHLRVGRQPRLPERHRLAVPAADLDGVGGRVPRQLRPGAGRERPGRRRQHHRDQQERQQPLPRLALRVPARRRLRLGQQVRRRQAEARHEPVRRLDRRPDHPQPHLLLRQLRGPAPEHRAELHRSRAQRRGAAPHPRRRAGGVGRGPEPRSHPCRRAAARRLPGRAGAHLQRAGRPGHA